jgi:hypothetical protein
MLGIHLTRLETLSALHAELVVHGAKELNYTPLSV